MQLVGVLAAAAALNGLQDKTSPTVRIPNLGTLGGTTATQNGYNYEAFLGVRYGTADRWESPVAVQPWQGTKEATKFAPSCVGSKTGDVKDGSEDCLFLNLYRGPNVNATRKLPVMLFIHGGGYFDGDAGSHPAQQLVHRADGGVIAITINYRLNIFGFLGADRLRGTDGSTGNWGIQDQRLAMLWAKRHVASFGGDPKRITVFGQSAGASSIGVHMVSPRSRRLDLYDGLIIESGLGVTWGSVPLRKAEEAFDLSLAAAGCVDAACLKGKTAKEVYEVSLAVELLLLNPGIVFPFSPAVDGVELTESPQVLIEKGEFDATVPVMAGTNRDEMTAFMWRIPMLGEEEFDLLLTPLLKNASAANLPELKRLYSKAKYVYPADMGERSFLWWQSMRAATDNVFTCPHRRAYHAMVGRLPALYTYFLVHPTQTHTDDTALMKHCVSHGAELRYALNCPSYPTVDSCIWSYPDEARLAHSISGFWVSFAQNGVPGGVWSETYNAAVDKVFILDTDTAKGFRFEEQLRVPQCDFWDAQL